MSEIRPKQNDSPGQCTILGLSHFPCHLTDILAYEHIIDSIPQSHGPVNDPLVRIRPKGLKEILVERGPVFERDGKIVVRGERLQRLFDTKEGYGFVKIIWRRPGPAGSHAN